MPGLRSERAIHVNIEIMRAFIRLRQAVSTHQESAQNPVALESKYDRQFKVVFDASRRLMQAPEPERRWGCRTNPITPSFLRCGP